MDRGDSVTDACRVHLTSATLMDIRQTRKGFCQECLGCEAKTEFKFFNSEKQQVAYSLEDTDCFCRMCCNPIHPFVMRVEEEGTKAELLTVDRPCVCCAPCPCKCCCYQTASFSSGGKQLGTITEQCYWCVPSFVLTDSAGKAVYKIHPPTCCAGMCTNCCTEGQGCGNVCCKVPFWVFDANQADTGGGDAPHLGKILKIPKSLKTEIFTDADAFEVTFPTEATASQKACLVGAAIFLNAVFFEGNNNQS